jgi:hypothetical protein
LDKLKVEKLGESRKNIFIFSRSNRSNRLNSALPHFVDCPAMRADYSIKSPDFGCVALSPVPFTWVVLGWGNW